MKALLIHPCFFYEFVRAPVFLRLIFVEIEQLSLLDYLSFFTSYKVCGFLIPLLLVF